MKKDISIRSRIKWLITLTILIVTISGCTLVTVFFLNFFLRQKEELVKQNMEVLYREAITNTMGDVDAFMNGVEETFSDYESMEAVLEILSSQVYMLNPSVDFFLLNSEGDILYATNQDMMDLFQQYEELDWGGGKIIGDEENIWYFNRMEIVDASNETAGYVVACEKITEQRYVDYLQQILHVEATIFYHDTRVVTTIIKESDEEDSISGTSLKAEIAVPLLEEQGEYIGIVEIFGKYYMAAYSSFGNEGEIPIGILFAGEPLSSFLSVISLVVISILLMGIFVFIVALKLSQRWLEKNIIHPLVETTELMTRIAEKEEEILTDLDKNYYSEFGSLMTAIFSMLSKLQESKKEVERIAFLDDITGLPNRFYVFREFSKKENKEHHCQGFFIFDIDGLNTVNNLYGRRTGDILLQEIAEYLKKIMEKNPGFNCFRIGGGSFLLLSNKKSEYRKLNENVESFMKRFENSFYCDGIMLQISISMGISLRTREEDTFDELFHHAELAMFEVKHSTKNNYCFYTEGMSAKLKERKEMEEELKNALEKKEFYLMYQPKYDLEKGSYDEFESLIRWNSSKYGFVSPGDFIDIAEESGLIVPIGTWVLKESCYMIKRLHEEFNQDFVVSVNISPNQLNREDFFNTVMESIIESGIEPGQLELEITENLLIKSLDTAIEKLRQLSMLGISISVDDFGKGYSSLAYLKDLPIHTLKIDKMFVDDIAESGVEKNSLVVDIIHLGHNLELKIVAEGVEKKEQSDYLKKNGCDLIQGYYYSRPLEEEPLKLFLKSKQGEKENENELERKL